MSATVARRPAIWLYLGGNRIAAAGMALSLVLIVIAILAPFIVPHDPLDQSFISANQPQAPSIDTAKGDSTANLTPHPWFSAFFYSHPTLVEREAALLGK